MPDAAQAPVEADTLETGILCDGLRALDLDIDNTEAAQAVRALAITIFGDTMTRFRANSSRVLMLYRAAEGSPSKRTLVGSDGNGIEILGHGQQFAAEGYHHTGAILQWSARTPQCLLPAVTEEQITAFLDEAAPFIGAAQTGVKAAPPAATSPPRGPTSPPYPALPRGGQQTREMAYAADVLAKESADLVAVPRGARNNAANEAAFTVGTLIGSGRIDEAIALTELFRACQANGLVSDDGEQDVLATLRSGLRAGMLSPRRPLADCDLEPAHYDLHTLRDQHGNTLADVKARTSGSTLHGGQPTLAAPNVDAGPELSILTRTRLPAPALPSDAFGPVWSQWIARTAAGASAPADYVAMALLAATSALVGNARWARAWHDWCEPPVLWCVSVGNPSSGKTPGAAPVMRDLLGQIETEMAHGYPDAVKRWQENVDVAAIREKKWKEGVARSVEAGGTPAEKPPEANAPDKPERPRVRVQDTTIEALAKVLKELPKSVLLVRDELAGWLLNLSRYSGGNDRPFWLESWTGGSYTVDRQKHPEPIYLPRLAVAIFGTIQPDRLNDVLTDTDDGLASRFIWAWPDPVSFRRPVVGGDIGMAAAALSKLAMLQMPEGEDGKPRPAYVSLTPDGANVLEGFAQALQVREAVSHGVLKGSVGKARGQALRLALVLTFLRWCARDGEPGPEPSHIDAEVITAAANLMWNYFLPMAERVLGDASIPAEERNGRTLAEWIARTRPAEVNVTSIRDKARLPGLRDSKAVKEACQYLADARWLAQAGASGESGRPRGDWIVNPRLWPALDRSPG